MPTQITNRFLRSAPDPAFFWVPQFAHPDVAGVTFGGFWCGRWIASQPNARNAGNIGGGRYGDNPDIADSAGVGTVKASTKKGVPAWRYISMLEARKACANLGPGYHLISRFEWASLALWCNMQGFQPHGNNKNSNPPADATFTTETAALDQAAFARNNTYLASLVGTGPATWNHNNAANGIADLNGNMWEWTDGLLMQQTTGYPYVLASLQVSLARSPYGKSTAVAAGSLTDANKGWTADEFLDATGNTYLYDSAGALFQVKTSTVANNATQIFLASGTPAAGPYTIVKLIATDITAGMTSGNRILTVRNADPVLAPFAIPATSDGTGATAYGKDYYGFDKASLRAALAGGSWGYGARAGVFALYLDSSASNTNYYVGFRVARAI
jgi:formylglycine-generating enzyme